jgi:hypothetical protein
MMRRLARSLSRLWLVLIPVWWVWLVIMTWPPEGMWPGRLNSFELFVAVPACFVGVPLLVYALGAVLFWVCYPLAEREER